MKKIEFESKIKELNVERIYFRGKQLEYEYAREFYNDEKGNVYGCYHNGHEYVIFFKDLERGVTDELDKFKTEDEAYDNLYERLIKWTKKKEKSIMLLIISPAVVAILFILCYIAINL